MNVNKQLYNWAKYVCYQIIYCDPKMKNNEFLW